MSHIRGHFFATGDVSNTYIHSLHPRSLGTLYLYPRRHVKYPSGRWYSSSHGPNNEQRPLRGTLQPRFAISGAEGFFPEKERTRTERGLLVLDIVLML